MLSSAFRCSSWKNSTKPLKERTCNHLQNYLGEEFEMFRVGKTTGSEKDEVITRSPKHKAIGSLMLAHKYTENIDPTGIKMSRSSNFPDAE